MTLILMRRASQLRMPASLESFQAIAAAHADALFVSGCSRCYQQDLVLAAECGLETYEWPEEYYDPELIFGARKADWLLDEHAGLDNCDSLAVIYHKFAARLLAMLESGKNRTMVLYFDQLMLELVVACLSGQGVALLKSFSLYLDEHALAIFGRICFGAGFQWMLLQSNIRAADAFYTRPELRLVN